MTNLTGYLDLDRLADVRLRLRHTQDADPALGCAIIALLLPGTIAAAAAGAWLVQPRLPIGSALDITGSVDEALRFLGQLGFGPGWTIIREGSDDPGTRSDGRHGVWLRYRFFDCMGSGWTAATALVDVAIHATALGAASYEEEETILLSPGNGLPRTHDDVEPSNVEDAWSNDLVKRTRQAVDDFWPNLNGMGRLCLKNCDGRFGAMDGYELHAGILRVVDCDEAVSTRYDTLESLLAAGWVLD